MASNRYRDSESPDESDVVEVKNFRTEAGLFSGLSIYFIQTKIEPSELDLLYSIAEASGANIRTNIEEADIIVTAITMRKRLERHIDWDIAKHKTIVTPLWITQSVANKKRLDCREYPAVCLFETCSRKNCPDHSCNAELVTSDTPAISSPTPKNLSYVARFAVQRASPLVCPNNDLVQQLAVVAKARRLDDEERSALSYSRSIGAIKSYPFLIERTEQVTHLPFIGPKLEAMIGEYLRTGFLSECDYILNAPRYQSLSLFTTVHGIGPQTARQLYAAGCRTLEDLDRYYGAELGRTEEDEPVSENEISGIRTALELREDLNIPIPRSEVESIDCVIAAQLEAVEPGCLRTIVGGYRRGKEMSNDVDIVYTHPQSGKERNLCKRLVQRLREQGLVTHVFYHSSFRSENLAHRPTGSSRGPDKAHWDTLDKSLVVFRLPSSGETCTKGVHRRVDLIFAPIETYWTAVVGWTGSTLFERDLRLWAKQKMGMKFDSSGITRRRDSKLFSPNNEHAVFELFGLEYIDPILRNADA